MRRLLALTIAVFFISCESKEEKILAEGGRWDLAFIIKYGEIIPGTAKFDFDEDGTFKIFSGGSITPGTYRTSKDSIWLDAEAEGEPTVAKYYFDEDKLKLNIARRNNPLSWEMHRTKDD